MDKVNLFAGLVRTFVRPVVTLGLVGTALFISLHGLPLDDWLRDLVIAVVGFWFGSRTNGESHAN